MMAKMPPPPGPKQEKADAAQGQMLSALSSLTQQLGILNQHMRDADTAAQQRARQVFNDQSVRDRSQPAAPMVTGPAGTLFGSSASTPDKVNQTTSDQEARVASAQIQQKTNVGGSTPPDASVSTRPKEDVNTPSEAEALTFAMLGTHGGPFGRLRLQQYMLQRNIDWTKNAAGKAQTWLAGQVPDGETAGTFNTLGQSALGGFSNVLGWMQSPKGQWAALGGLAAYRGGEHLINAITNWNDAGRALGYGNEQSLGIFGFRDPLRQLGASGQGLSLKMEQEGLMGRLPGFLGGQGLSFSGLTKDQAKQAVGTLASQGFSNQGGYSNWVNGDNTRIAENLLGPLMNMGLTAQDAAQWTPALRNANTSMQTLMDTLNQTPAAARAAKMTVSDFNASLYQTATTSVSQGGTLQGGAQMGMSFTEATGMAPAIGSAIAQNPIYTALMMGQYGVLPSGVPNLPGGAQVQGMLSAFNLLRGATGGLNKNHYENVAGMQLPTAYGYQLQDAQIAQMLGVDQATVNRLRREANSPKIASVLGQLGNEGSNGMPGTGIWSILGQAQDWKHLTAAQQRQATSVWDATAGANINHLGLKQSQIKDIYSTHDIRKRMTKLQTDLLGSQQNNPQNQITVYVKFKGEAAKHFQQAAPANVKIAANSGQGQAINSVVNSPYGEAAIANNWGAGAFNAMGAMTPNPADYSIGSGR